MFATCEQQTKISCEDDAMPTLPLNSPDVVEKFEKYLNNSGNFNNAVNSFSFKI